MAEYHFGRLVAYDARDQNFPMALRLDPLIAEHFPNGLPEGVRQYRAGRVLNQGPTGTCGAHAGTCRLMSGPIMQPLPQGLTPFDFYRRIVLNDEWTENDHEATAPLSGLQFGTSTRAVLKTGQDLGCFPNYLWARSAEDIRGWHLAGFGGGLLGIWWRSEMFEPDSEGFVSYAGSREGGHLVCTTMWNDRRRHNGRIVRAVRIQNSWGASWGQGGRCWMEYDELQTALGDEGEFGAPTEVRVT
jgi:hypothetical protein